jgi:hypothetical protein
MQGPWLNTLQNVGVHGSRSNTLQGACANGVASIWRRCWAVAGLSPAIRTIRQIVMHRTMQANSGDPVKLVRVLVCIKADRVHILAFMAERP